MADVGSLSLLCKRCKGVEFGLWVNPRHFCNMPVRWNSALAKTLAQIPRLTFGRDHQRKPQIGL
jgi:hypothetical protein